MTAQPDTFTMPPIAHKDDGCPRLVGFELEFSGLTLDETTTALQHALGGELSSHSDAEKVLSVETLGEFRVELDWDFLKRKASEEAGSEDSGDWMETLSRAAAVLVPTEVVCPPISIDNLEVLQSMVAALREAGAVGTEESLIAAYGVHINAEIPKLDAPTLSGYLKAFALLQWWLVKVHNVDTTRKVSPYIDLYSETYLRQVLSQQAASMDEIISAYLEHNATRNRALDLLPLLAEIDEDRVRRAVNDPKIKPRPTFHYRLPNCQIEKADWTLANSWNTWCVVETLASREEDLSKLGAEFLNAARPILGVSRQDWIEFVDQWLKDRELV
jgi:hypothetical protein